MPVVVFINVMLDVDALFVHSGSTSRVDPTSPRGNRASYLRGRIDQGRNAENGQAGFVLPRVQ
jgi:hypothetical protein